MLGGGGHGPGMLMDPPGFFFKNKIKPMCVEGDLREHGSEVLAASRYREHILHREHIY